MFLAFDPETSKFYKTINNDDFDYFFDFPNTPRALFLETFPSSRCGYDFKQVNTMDEAEQEITKYFKKYKITMSYLCIYTDSYKWDKYVIKKTNYYNSDDLNQYNVYELIKNHIY